MAFPRSRSRGIGHGSRRKTAWQIGPFGQANVTAAGVLLFATGAQALVDGATIVRTRGELSVALGPSTTALAGFDRIGFGMCIVSENAFGIGVTAVPTPITDIAWDGWLFHDLMSIFTIQDSETWSNSGSPFKRVEIDSKAMRKIKNTDVLIGVMEFSSETGTATIEARLNTRVLVKLA